MTHRKVFSITLHIKIRRTVLDSRKLCIAQHWNLQTFCIINIAFFSDIGLNICSAIVLGDISR